MKGLIIRVLKLMKRPRIKYGKGTNNGTLKVRRKYSTATVKVRLCSTELVQLCKVNRTYNVPKVIYGNFVWVLTVSGSQTFTTQTSCLVS